MERARGDAATAARLIVGTQGLAPGSLFDGRFFVRQLLGQGGMGAVYLADDRDAGRSVALKVILGDPNERARERFRREGAITASLEHPGIVRVHSAGEAEGVLYLAYELVAEARSLDEASREADLLERVRYVHEAAKALGFAHRAGVVHRDVKPDNVLVDASGRVRVTDFGLAVGGDLERLTKTGALVGTPTHMSPEQANGERAGAQSDVWALGVLLYQALTRELPFQADSLSGLVGAILTARVRQPRKLDPSVPRPLADVCLRALERDRRLRYADGEAFADALAAALRGQRDRALQRRTTLASLAIGASLVLSVGLAARVLTRDAASTTSPTEVEALTLELSEPSDGAQLDADAAVIRGRARGGTPPYTLTITGQAPQRVQRSFRARAPLAPGVNRVEVVLSDEGGGRVQLVRSVTRTRPPDWVFQIPEAERPPTPLPSGLRYGDRPGTYVGETDGSVLVFVPGGRFPMGPPHAAQPTEVGGFFLGRLEVTWRQYMAFCAATGTRARSRGLRAYQPPRDAEDDEPVMRVTFKEASAYCAWAGLRLPSEAEWEFAARGGSPHPYPWGAHAPRRFYANLLGEADGYRDTSPVGSFGSGIAPCGAMDLVGNVREWVTGAFEPGTQTYVVKGSDYMSPRSQTPAWLRLRARPGDNEQIVGFRVAR